MSAQHSTAGLLGFQLSDGGRSAAGFKGGTGDCVVRAIAIAFDLPYRQVYDTLRDLNEAYAQTRRSRVAKRIKARGATPRLGNFRQVYGKYIEQLGGEWVSTMGIGTGCKVHLRADEIPDGVLIVKVSKHLLCVKDHVIHDNHDPSRNGTRCVYGYYKIPQR